ncbi:glycosyltransferase family 4 protein [Terracidiphilus sp.]|jgi:glycosyltransferase involved in cell wall biosynthesis|uniref:glycosyltransferase family 4 protein n=1 Tax=Terracidiphilus sp. TaxID=1964191 RepID=UPI003C1E985C
MNIVILSDFAYVDGGASKIALGSAVALAERGHRVLVFSAVGPVDSMLRETAGLTVVCLGQHEIVADPNRLRAIVRGFWNRNAAVRLRESLADFSPDNTILHLHTWTKGLSGSVVRLAASLGFRVVLTLHDYFSVCPTGSFFIHPTKQLCTLRPMSAACIATNCDSRNYGHKLWRVGRQWAQSHPGRLPGGIRDFISISNLSQQLIQPFLPPDMHMHRVPNFIDIEQREPANVEAFSTFSFAGRLSPEKGPDLLAECARMLALNVRFIGSGPLKDELMRIAPSVTVTGWQSPPQARELMRQSRALVFPSRWYETQGLVVAEAAAMGVPVIVPSTSAAREWVEDGVTGLIFKGGDVKDLALKITRLRDAPSLASALGREAYDRYWQKPATLIRHCEQLEETYRKILSSAPRLS